MRNYTKLLSVAKNGIVRAKDLTALKVSRDYLKYAVQDGIIEKVAHGIYIEKNGCKDQLFLFQIKNSRLIFSCFTSAYLLDMTTRDSEKI